MGIYSMLTQLGPLLGPFLGKEKKTHIFYFLNIFVGGLISQTLGWR